MEIVKLKKNVLFGGDVKMVELKYLVTKQLLVVKEEIFTEHWPCTYGLGFSEPGVCMMAND